MKFIKKFVFISTFVAVFSTSNANAQIVEGDAAKKKFESDKNSSSVLYQRKKKFYYSKNGADEVKKPKEITIKAGEPLFIINEEKKITHNVYDETDGSWVLKKQKPGGTAYTTFSKPGVHKLRCAIHPKMKVSVTVVE